MTEFEKAEERAYRRFDGQLGGASLSFGFGHGLKSDNILPVTQKTARRYICDCGFECPRPSEIEKHIRDQHA